MDNTYIYIYMDMDIHGVLAHYGGLLLKADDRMRELPT